FGPGFLWNGRRLGLPKNRYVAAFGQLDYDRILAAFGGIVLAQPRPKPRHLAPHGRIQFGIIVRFAAIDPHANEGLLQLARPALQLLLYQKSEQPREALTARKAGARE